MQCCKLHKFIVYHEKGDQFNTMTAHEKNYVECASIVHFEDDLHSEPEVRRACDSISL